MKAKCSLKLFAARDQFFFNTLFRMFYEAFLDILFASVYNIYNIKWEEGGLDIYSNVVALFCIFIFTTMFLVVPVYYYFNRSSTKPLVRLKMLMEDYKPEKRYLMMDHFIFMLRRAILISVIVFGWNHGFVQVSIFSISCIGVLVWKIIARPFESTLLNIQEIIFEFFISVIIVIFISFSGKSTELVKSGPPHFVGMICFVIIVFLTLLSFVFSICLFIQN
jgi:hypothetical protein